jgi:sialic acid synthase SpsE
MVFIVAEIGVNWDGDFKLAEEMVSKSKEFGCDAVKFQSFNKELIQKHPEASRLIQSSITSSNIDQIAKISESVDIEWFSTPMYPDAVKILDPYVKRFKIRWFDGQEIIQNKESEIVEKILDTKKQIIVSSDKSPKNSIYYNNKNFKWLYCVPKYPCELQDFEFSLIKDFDGFSNHCPHFLAPLTANILGAEIIEIHITSDKLKNFVDNNVSFEYKELKQLVELLRISDKIKK